MRPDGLRTVREYAAVVRLHDKSVRRLIVRQRQSGAVRIDEQW
jgi:hypothetical protein